MKQDRASRTAMLVTVMRAVAHEGVTHVPGFQDPTARAFLTPDGAARVDKIVQATRAGEGGVRAAFARFGADMMALRTTTIDAALRDAIAGGNTQLVILGAGFDGRAWRMKELAGVRVFEVDHPATQAEKRSHLSALGPSFGEVSFVPVDFERGSLDTALQRAGHDPSRPTCWIWEGVVMYLTHEAMQATLRHIATRSAEGSTLIINYHSEPRRGLAAWIFRLIGEPMISHWSPEEMATVLRTARFRAEQDSGMQDWAATYAKGPIDVKRGNMMRVVVARRTSG